MVFDPSAPVTRRFSMASLGSQMGLEEPSVPAPKVLGVPYLNGHTINPVFLSYYEKLGAHIIGEPISELRYNPLRKRYEQFFENLGLYRKEGSDEVGLLAYGAWACDFKCRTSNVNADRKMDIYQPIDPAFHDYVERMGADFTGFGLTEAYTAKDGNKEQVLENVVVAAYPDQKVDLRPLADKLSIQPETPRPYSGDPNNYFYATDGDKGYEIPKELWDYVLQHGGIEIFGPPITHYAPLFGTAYHQCFAKLCLAYNLSATDGARVRPEPLGYAYKVLYYGLEPVPTATSTPLPTIEGQREVVLQVWVRYPAIDSSQAQEVGAIVLENDLPIADGLLGLVLTLPDGRQQTYPFPPTNEKGMTGLRIPPITGSNGTLVPYRVCLEMQQGIRFCVAESFVIWNNP